MYYGTLCVNGEYIGQHILLETEVDGVKGLKAIFYDGKTYPVYQKGLTTYALPRIHINEYLTKQGVGYLAEDFYDKYDFPYIMRAAEEIRSITEEEKEKIEDLICFAVDWWTEVLVARCRAINKPILNEEEVRDEEKIRKFKEYLGNKIRMWLIVFSNTSILYDYGLDDTKLRYAVIKSGIGERIDMFPWKTTMDINLNGIEVCLQGKKETIYSVDSMSKKVDKLLFLFC